MGPWGSEGDLGMRFGGLGVTLEGPWGVLGTLGMAFGGLWGLLGRLRGALGVSLRGLG